ncbi:MAG TPA: hypothetical protein VNU84_06105 [Candidatus Acidoferrum sp.]|jgi:capsule polysaccharide export protein KpsE/RkpR|nr:hypothetical protein [Candidatus Acidoferrum sp.]
MSEMIKTDETLADHFETEVVYGETASVAAARRRAIARLELLWEQRKFLLKMALGGIVLSLAIALLWPPLYESSVALMPPDEQNGSGLAALATLAGRATGTNALTGLASSLLGAKTTDDLFIGVLRSRTVAGAIVTKFDLHKVYKTKLWIATAKRLATRTKITEDKKSGIITIVVSDRSPQRAAGIAQEYVNQLDWVMAQLNTSSAHRERVFLEGRLQEVTGQLEIAEKDFSAFASRNAALDIPEQGKAMVEAGAELEGQLIAAQTEVQGMKEIYADDNVRVRAMEARVQGLQQQIEKLGGTPGQANGNITNDALYPSIRKLPLLGVQYADLLRATKVQEAVFEVLTQEYELAKVQEAKEIPSVKVLDAPNIAERKSSPPRRVITIVGTLLAFGGGAFWILATDRWRRIDPRDPRKSFAARVYLDLLRDLPWIDRKAKKHSPITDEELRS